MTNKPNSGPKGREEDDPLSATAMFFRTLDQQAGGKPQEPDAKFDFGAPEPAPGGQNSPPARPQSRLEEGEFTAIFGKPSAGPATPRAPSQPPPGEVIPHPQSEQDPVAKQGQSEFTRIFVKGASASPKPADKALEPTPEAAPPRAKGFSSPGVSDSASGHNSFSQFFKPVANVESTPAQPVPRPDLFRPGTSRPNSTPDSFRSESPFDLPDNKPKSSVQDPQSITSLIQSLSSDASSGIGSRVSEPAPYRPESQSPFRPVAPPSAPPAFESGGVTQFIQRLAEMPPTPVVDTPVTSPIREKDSGPGEFTRIISAPGRSVESKPSVSATTPGAASAPTPVFNPPAVPASPVVPATPPPRAMAPRPAPMPAVQPPAIPAPHVPPVPAPAAVAAPKGKLEAIVPMLLVVNTFLLVVILVVIVFLIKSK